MANTYTQIHIHAVFAVQNRHCSISENWKTELYKYISGIIQNNNHKLIAINGMPDHIHILFGLRPTQTISDLMQDIKGSSSKWINERKLTGTKFTWQEGYSAFSYARKELPIVINYINNQAEHHQKKSFIDEYLDLLKEFHIEYDEKYIFKPL